MSEYPETSASPDPFDRIKREVGPHPAPGGTAARPDKPAGEIIMPVPAEAPPPPTHPGNGEPSETWTYRDASGRALFLMARFDKPGGKEVLPLTLWREAGRLRWRWKAAPEPRPLYGLDELVRLPTVPVLVVEGEKTADAARKRFPDLATVTWPGGSRAVAKADWTPLAGREVIMWPDADKAGRDAAQAIVRAARMAGATTVAAVRLPTTLPPGWDLADDWLPGFTFAAALALIDDARRERVSSDLEWPPGYRMEPNGLFFGAPDGEGKGVQFLSAPFEVLAEARDLHGGGWGVVIRFRDRDGREKVEFVSRARLSSGGAEARGALADAGLVTAGGRGKLERFSDALARVKLSSRMTVTDATGWCGETFVMPHRSVGPPAGEAMLFTRDRCGFYYAQKGELDAWRSDIATRAIGNDLLTFALAAAFVGPLLGPLGMEGGGFHFRGSSSCGKTTVALAAGSTWGGGGPLGFAHSWRTTANALEGVAAAHSDCLLVLDELSLVAPEEAGAAAYQLASGQAKGRSQTNGSLRRRAEWRVFLLSTGEIGLASHIEASRKGDRSMTGQELRMLDIEADAGKGLGVWQDLHGLDSPATLSDVIKAATERHYGHAGPAFLETFVRDRGAAIASVRELVAAFLDAAREAGDTGQAERGARKFAFVAAAGELAAIWGIVPWPRGAAAAAALALFKRWAAGFGRAQSREDQEILRRMRHILEADRTAFEVLDDKTEDGDEGLPADDLLGPWRSRDGEARQLRIKGYIFAWRPSPQKPKEIIAGFHDAGWADTFKGLDTKQAARVLADHGFVIRGDGDRSKRAKKVRRQNRRLYWVRVALLEADLGE